MHLIILYLVMFLGIFLEGEMILLSSVIAAHHGYLNLWIVVIIGVTGAYCSDYFYFFLGRKKGKDWINRNQKIKNKAEIIVRKLEKYPKIILVGYRFLYGFRSITLLVIGASKTKTNNFLLFSAISILIWASVYCSIGYLFGEIIKSELGHIQHIEKYIIGVLVLFGVIFMLIKHIIKNREKNMLIN